MPEDTSGKPYPDRIIEISFARPHDCRNLKVRCSSSINADQMIQGLIQVGFLQPPHQTASYALLTPNGLTMAPNATPESLGVLDGDTIAVLVVGGCGPWAPSRSLTPALLASRLAFDWYVMQETRWTQECTVTGYVCMADAKRGRAATEAEGKAGRVTVYDADVRFRMFSGPGAHIDYARIRIDLLASGNYPFGLPYAQVISRPLPWAPNVHPSCGMLDVGASWVGAKGRASAAQFVVGCLRVLNCDEFDRGGFGVYQPEAYRFWREVMGCKPLHPNLAYPSLPLHLLAGVTEAQVASGTGGSLASEPTGNPSKDKPLAASECLMVPLSLLLGGLLCAALILAILRKALAWPLGKAPIGPAALTALLALLFVSAPDLWSIAEAALAEAARGPWPALPAEAPGAGAVAAYLAFAALGYAVWHRREGGAEGRKHEKPPGHRRRLPPPPPKGALPPAGEA